MWPHQAAKCKDSSPVLVLWQSFVSAPQTAVTLLSDFLPWYRSPNKRIMNIKDYVISFHTSHCAIWPVFDRLENRSLKLFPQKWAVSTLQASDIFRTLIPRTHQTREKIITSESQGGLHISKYCFPFHWLFIYSLCRKRWKWFSICSPKHCNLLCKFRIYLSLPLELKVSKYNFSGVSGTVSLLFLSLASRNIKLTPWNINP